MECKFDEFNVLDVDRLLSEVAAEDASSADLEYDPLFLELEQAFRGKPEVEYGDVITMATPPDWKSVKLLALQLFSRAHDLRVAVALVRALIHVQGFAGFALGLKLIERLLADHWGSMHPRLDPGDGNDPTLRVNTLSTLVERTEILQDVRGAPLVSSRAHGAFCLRDVDIIAGDAPAADDKPSLPVIDAAFLDADQAEIEAMHQALDMACNSTLRIETILTERVGAAQSLDLSPLTKMLKRAKDFVGNRLAKGKELAVVEMAVDGVPAAQQQAVNGAIGSREDVVRLLEEMCAYFASHEPASPIPLLLQRAKRLVDKNFVEIMQDLAPEGLNQVYQISGIQDP